MFLLQFQLTVQLGDGVEDLGKVGALEDPKHDGTEGVAHDGAKVGVHGHLEQLASVLGGERIGKILDFYQKRPSF